MYTSRIWLNAFIFNLHLKHDFSFFSSSAGRVPGRLLFYTDSDAKSLDSMAMAHA